MMTIVMIDVEAGKEDLFDRLYTNLSEMKDKMVSDKIEILYVAKCYTHSDISLMVDVKDPEALPPFVVNIILQMDGVWDIQLIPLLNPRFFKIPEGIEEKGFHHFTVTLDVRAQKTKSVYKNLIEMASKEEDAIPFIAYSFASYENDIILSFLSQDIASAGRFVEEKIRSIDGVIDTYLWQIEKWQFICSDQEWLSCIQSVPTEEPLELDIIERSFKKIMDSYISAL
ncbi:MAG: hypothetical protein JSV49_08685 [Thermoplasmata archaeon]|nr:MAG: hypothetical protein JSV49_08685 [Thermoplasmata archaeon]